VSLCGRSASRRFNIVCLRRFAQVNREAMKRRWIPALHKHEFCVKEFARWKISAVVVIDLDLTK